MKKPDGTDMGDIVNMGDIVARFLEDQNGDLRVWLVDDGQLAVHKNPIGGKSVTFWRDPSPEWNRAIEGAIGG